MTYYKLHSNMNVSHCVHKYDFWEYSGGWKIFHKNHSNMIDFQYIAHFLCYFLVHNKSLVIQFVPQTHNPLYLQSVSGKESKGKNEESMTKF
jgi:hypothetical protein